MIKQGAVLNKLGSENLGVGCEPGEGEHLHSVVGIPQLLVVCSKLACQLQQGTLCAVADLQHLACNANSHFDDTGTAAGTKLQFSG